MKWLSIFILLTCSLFAITITDQSQNLSRAMEIAIDSNRSQNLQDVLKKDNFVINTKGIQNFGYNQNIFWVKLTLTNPTDLITNRLLELYFPPMDYIDVAVLDSNQSVQQKFLSGDLRPIEQRVIGNKYHLFPLTFQPGETKIILLKLQNSGAMVINPILHSPSAFWEHIYPKRESFIVAFLAIIVFFTLYNLVLFMSLKEISFIYYSLAMVSMFAMQASLFEVAYEYVPFLGLWNLTITANIAGALFIVFSVLFVSAYFELENYIPRFEKLYKRIIIIVYFPLIVLLLLPSTYSMILPLITIAGIMMIFFILALTFIGYKKSPLNYRYIFIGWLMSGTLMIVYVLELIGLIHMKPMDDLTIRIGTLIEMIFFSFALGDKLKFLKSRAAEAEIKALESERQMLIKAKLATAGETVGNIAHQWRQPLNRLSMVLLKIQSDLHFKHEIDKEALVRETNESEMILKDMSKTIDLFLNFFADNQNDETFFIMDGISDAVSIIQDTLHANGINLIVNTTTDCKLKGSKSELAQIVLNLLSNSQNAHLSNQTLNGWIQINVTCTSTEIHIEIADNASGIKIKPIESVFEPYISSGNNKNGAGLGLYIVRNLITHRFGGEINVNNINGGAVFKITLPSKL